MSVLCLWVGEAYALRDPQLQGSRASFCHTCPPGMSFAAWVASGPPTPEFQVENFTLIIGILKKK